MMKQMIVTLASIAALNLSAFEQCDKPETWFHIIGGNASKAGLTADMEALKAAGYGGIQFFHGQFGEAKAWDGVHEQIPCLSAKWDDLVRHLASECARLGLTFRMQNCPGWSMSGGPWIKPSEAQRKLVYVRADGNGDTVPKIELPDIYSDLASDWHDVVYLAFPTPEGDTADFLQPVKAEQVKGKLRWRYTFAKPETIRSIQMPAPRFVNSKRTYIEDVRVILTARTEEGPKQALNAKYPNGCWQATHPLTFATDEQTAKEWELELVTPYPAELKFVRFSSAAKMDNYEMLAGHTLRSFIERDHAAVRSAKSYIAEGSIREVKVGDALPPGMWTILRVGQVNMKKVNAPAPKEATGWECDKLDPRGIEKNFASYIQRVNRQVLAKGMLKGMIVDSWECERQTWTWEMERYFREANGYEVRLHLPEVFGWVVGSPEKTDKFLLDWRRTISDLITKNYYGRMSQLAQAEGLDVAYETSFGDVVPGDIMEYWKYCDIPMCEYWVPFDAAGSVGHPSYKPVMPCASAAHVYGKKRVQCESFTNTRLTWDENFRQLKEQAIRHFARGVTHTVTHTCTHNPQTDGRVPGTSFGSFIGTPFIRGQTWWSYMPHFTGWLAECGAFLERGLPAIDVLMYLGDAIGHKPDEVEHLPFGYKCDYLNHDALDNRLSVKNNQIVFPDGFTVKRIWVPEGTYLNDKSKARLREITAQGGSVVYGDKFDAIRELKPQLELRAATGDLPVWYHRLEGEKDLYFLAAETNGFKGTIAFNTQDGEVLFDFDLGSTETKLIELPANGAPRTSPPTIVSSVGADVLGRPRKLESFTLSFPPNWGAAEKVELNKLVAWRDLKGVNDETKAFSGTATYTTRFTGKATQIDLGKVRDCARVYVNGELAATLWAAPYRCNIEDLTTDDENELKIEVTSSWYNRLAYDKQQKPENRRTWTVWDVPGLTPPCLKKGAKLEVSGLLGPVVLR